jgi:hypothetical protein
LVSLLLSKLLREQDLDRARHVGSLNCVKIVPICVSHQGS